MCVHWNEKQGEEFTHHTPALPPTHSRGVRGVSAEIRDTPTHGRPEGSHTTIIKGVDCYNVKYCNVKRCSGSAFKTDAVPDP